MYQPGAAVRGPLSHPRSSASRQAATCELDAEPAALISRLEQELTSLSSTAVHALTSVRLPFGPGSAPPKLMIETTEQWLTLVAEALDSAMATHQALRAHTAPPQDER